MIASQASFKAFWKTENRNLDLRPGERDEWRNDFEFTIPNFNLPCYMISIYRPNFSLPCYMVSIYRPKFQFTTRLVIASQISIYHEIPFTDSITILGFNLPWGHICRPTANLPWDYYLASQVSIYQRPITSHVSIYPRSNLPPRISIYYEIQLTVPEWFQFTIMISIYCLRLQVTVEYHGKLKLSDGKLKSLAGNVMVNWNYRTVNCNHKAGNVMVNWNHKAGNVMLNWIMWR